MVWWIFVQILSLLLKKIALICIFRRVYSFTIPPSTTSSSKKFHSIANLRFGFKLRLLFTKTLMAASWDIARLFRILLDSLIILRSIAIIKLALIIACSPN